MLNILSPFYIQLDGEEQKRVQHKMPMTSIASKKEFEDR